MEARSDQVRSGAANARGSMDAAVEGRITPDQIESRVRGFADRYYALISSAADAIGRSDLDPETRLSLSRLQSRTVTAVFDIATNADPFTQLLDMTVVVTLTAIVAIDEGVAEKLFGDSAQLLIGPMRRAREEIWTIAALAMTSEQLETLDRLILDWRRQNPEVESVSFVRFDDFAASRGKSVIANVRTGTGFFAPVDAATEAVNEARAFGERVFFMSKRAPLLITMEAGVIANQVAVMPEVQDSVTIGEQLAVSADRISRVAETLPQKLTDERERVITTVERASSTVQDTLQQYQTAISRTEDLVTSVSGLSTSARELIGSLDTAAATLTNTLAAAERLAETISPPVDPNGPPQQRIDPEVYARIVSDLKGSLVEVNTALASTKSLVEGPLWQRPLEEVDRISRDRVDHASHEARGLVEVIFLRLLVLAGVCFLLMVFYKGWASWLGNRSLRRTSARSTDRILGSDLTS